MTGTDSPDDLVRRFIDLLADKDLDGAFRLVAEDCEYDNVPIGTVRGPAGIRSVLEGFFASCERLDWVIERQVADGTITAATVINERLDKFLIHGRWAVLPVAGVFEVRDGKIALWRDFFDRETLFAAMSPDSQ